MVDVDSSSDNPLVDQNSDLRNNYLQDANPLENLGAPDPESGSTGFMTGNTAFEAGWTIAQGVDQNDLGLIISGVAAAALDAVSAAVDPIAYVAGQLFSWMLEHVEPARAALHAVTGNPDMVKAYAATWTNIEKEMLAVGGEFEQSLAQVQGWTGQAADAYRDRATAVAGIAKGAAGGAHGIAGITMAMAEVVGPDRREHDEGPRQGADQCAHLARPAPRPVRRLLARAQRPQAEQCHGSRVTVTAGHLCAFLTSDICEDAVVCEGMTGSGAAAGGVLPADAGRLSSSRAGARRADSDPPVQR